MIKVTMELLPRDIARANAKKSLLVMEDFQSGLHSQPLVSYRCKPKTQRGLHGASKQFEKLQNYIGSGMKEDRLDWIDTLHEVEKIKIYPDAFVYTTKDKKHVECTMKNQYPDSFDANKLKVYDPPNSFSLIPPEDHKETLCAWHPPFLAAQFCRSEVQQNQPKITRATRK
ncbi:hypothetical protein P692DRAFT_201806872 [Suillus brevipes Sb2]|nr:hypothetical protein P692DRAFT_201806872 [Suillus brevipes Sb2]